MTEVEPKPDPKQGAGLPGDKQRLQEGMKAILKEASERKVRQIIAETLGLPSGTPKHEELLTIWKECRQSHGWLVSG